jgi:hypothetical protein
LLVVKFLLCTRKNSEFPTGGVSYKGLRPCVSTRPSTALFTGFFDYVLNGTDAVKRIAPNHAVDPDELLRKVPDLFPGDLVKQQEIDGFMSEFLVRTEGMTLAEK